MRSTSSLLSMAIVSIACLTQSHAQNQSSLSPEAATQALISYATQGDIEAQYLLGMAYLSGNGVSKDKAKSAELFLSAAKKGHAKAQYALGMSYARGDGVPKDMAKTFEWWSKAAAQSYPQAEYGYGMMLLDGAGVTKADIGKGIEYITRASDHGLVEAQRSLGEMYVRGDGVPKDLARGVELLNKAAIADDGEAQYGMSVIYWSGLGVPKDYVLAYTWASLATKNGIEKAASMRSSAETKMTEAEGEEARRMTSTWRKGISISREATGVPATKGQTSRRSTGTAFVVSPKGFAVSNQHVIQSCREIRIAGNEGVATVVVEDSVNDLAVLKLPYIPKQAATIAVEPSKIRQGDEIFVYGYPLNAVLSSGGNMTSGVVSALTGLGNNTNQIQITAPIQPGSSGSPVLNRRGEVVAVVSSKLSDSSMARATGQVAQNVNFAVSGQTLRSFLDVHQVPYLSRASSDKSTSSIADEARKWTVIVECYK